MKAIVRNSLLIFVILSITLSGCYAGYENRYPKHYVYPSNYYYPYNYYYTYSSYPFYPYYPYQRFVYPPLNSSYGDYAYNRYPYRSALYPPPHKASYIGTPGYMQFGNDFYPSGTQVWTSPQIIPRGWLPGNERHFY